MLAVLAGVQCARVPAQDEHSVGRVRRSNPWNFFNKNKNTKKVVKKGKKKPQPKPTTQAPTTSTPTITTTTPTTTPSVKMTVKVSKIVLQRYLKTFSLPFITISVIRNC